MNLYGDLYNGKLEKKYFFLPKICRKSNNYSNDLSNNSNINKNIFIYLFFYYLIIE